MTAIVPKDLADEPADVHALLEQAYTKCHRPEYISPDPLEFIYHYENDRDREIAGIIAATLAYGRVKQIRRNIARVLDPMGASPRRYLEETRANAMLTDYAGFQHRWTTAADLLALLAGVRRVLRSHGSLGSCFLAHHAAHTGDTREGLIGFVNELSGGRHTSLLSDPSKTSACKRLHLYLRWMVRKDTIDPGCWEGIDPAQLIVPLDTHMYKTARALGMTQRKQPNLAAALDMTEAFRGMVPDDPLRYDFALTRLGIRDDLDLPAFLERGTA